MRISVVIPCYNREGTVGRAIQSALDQSVPPCEVIVVDDGSSDDSASIARRFGSNVTLVKKENSGPAAARNRGIREASGDWIAFLDSDDFWQPNKLARQLEAYQRFPSSSLIFCDTTSHNGASVTMSSRFEKGGIFGAEAQRSEEFARYDRSFFMTMLTQSRVITSAVLVNRTLPELKFSEDIWGSEDWALWLTLAARYEFSSVDDRLVVMFQQGDNISARKGKLYRNDVEVLRQLEHDPILTQAEQTAVSRERQKRMVGAVYFSLMDGDSRDARELLRKIPAGDLGVVRYFAYRLACRLPPAVLHSIASTRAHRDTEASIVYYDSDTRPSRHRSNAQLFADYIKTESVSRRLTG